MTIDMKSCADITSRPPTLAAAFRLSWELDGPRNIIKGLVPTLLLIALLLLLVPVCIVVYLNAEHNAKFNALYEQVQSLQQQVGSLQMKCRALPIASVVKNNTYLEKQIQKLVNGRKKTVEKIGIKVYPLMNTSHSQQHHTDHLLRQSRAARKPLEKCPKNLAAKQFRGAVTQFIPSNGFVTVWNEEVWCDQGKSKKIYWDDESRGIKIMETALYLVHAQLTFNKFEQMADFELLVQSSGSTDPNPVSICHVSKEGDDDELSPKTCSTSLLLCLNKNDTILMFVKLPDLMINLEKISSFIGLTRVNRMKTCPSV